MIWGITIAAVTAYLVVTLTPWRRASDLVQRCISRMRRCRLARTEQTFGQNSAHIPQHKSGKV